MRGECGRRESRWIPASCPAGPRSDASSALNLLRGLNLLGKSSLQPTAGLPVRLQAALGR
eukprot:2541033-Heterocapsa_arctica.AAC.1